jgi:hypothetical protein
MRRGVTLSREDHKGDIGLVKTSLAPFGLAAWFLLIGSGCATPEPPDFEPIVPAAVYDDLYPNYIQLCAVSQIRPLGEDEGGSAGHAVMYLDDMCRVEDAA